jgi:sodium/potassium-transporting ATPase subunit beta
MALGSGFEEPDSGNYFSSLARSLRSAGRFIYNSEDRTVIGRDGLSWLKISIFYAVFYTFLASFFIGFLAVFAAQLDFKKPTYFSDSSLMASRIPINPGLGYRPQVDPEDSLIYYVANESESNFYMQTQYLRIFLENHYDAKPNDSLIQNCENKEPAELEELLKNGTCNFDYRSVLKGTLCDPDEHFGYMFAPCVAVKLNKIYSWMPEPYSNSSFLPESRQFLFELAKKKEEVLRNNVLIHCEGEYSSDRDNLNKTTLVYYSSVSAKYDKLYSVGMLPVFYYPYLNQDEYRQPLVFISFFNIPPNTLINVICRAYASNIDNEDKQMLRGMTRIQLFMKREEKDKQL